MQTSGSWHKVFCFPGMFVEVCKMINADITWTFLAPEKDCIFWGWWCLSPHLFGGAACTSSSSSLTTLTPWLLQCILSLPWDEMVTDTSYLPQRQNMVFFSWINFFALDHCFINWDSITKKGWSCLFWHWKHHNQTTTWSTYIKVPQNSP